MKSPLLLVFTVTTAIFSTSVAEEFQFQSQGPSLSDIWLQLARSLEETEHIAPYITHVIREHERVSKLHEEVRGAETQYTLPEQISEENLKTIFNTWDEMPEAYKLSKMAQKSGRLIRLAIEGEDGKPTAIVALLNWHQNRPEAFPGLLPDLLRLSTEGESFAFVMREERLTEAEQASFQFLIEKPRFTESDLPKVEEFYAGPYDRLSEFGKSLLSTRVWAGQRGENVKPTEAEQYTREFREMYESIFKQFEAAKINDVEPWLVGVLELMGGLTFVELDIAVIERNLVRESQSVTSKSGDESLR